MPSRAHFRISAGEDRTLSLVARNTSGAIVDLTDYSISWSMAARKGANPLVQKTGTVVSASAGTFTISLTDSDTGLLKAGSYFHQAIATSGATSINVAEGNIQVDLENTGALASSLGAVYNNNQLYSTRAEVTTTKIGMSPQWLITGGYSVLGDGLGASYKRVGAAVSPVTVTSADGALWERMHYKTTQSAAPSSVGSWDSISTAFTGDWTNVHIPIERIVTGSALGSPSSSYYQKAENHPIAAYLYSSSGHNESLSGNDGRTGLSIQYLKFDNYGQGDLNGATFIGFVNNTRAGATNFLANPAVTMWNGSLYCGVSGAGALLNGYEINLHDQSHDCAGIGANINSDRNVATGALSAYWAAFRSQSQGMVAIDTHFSASGKARFGLDLSFCTFDSDKAAITLKANDRIYFNVTASDASGLSRYPSAVSDAYVTYSSALGAINFVSNNGSILQLYSTSTGAIFPVKVRTDVAYYVSTLQVVGARDTGWAAMTGSINKASVYDTSTVTTAQLAGRVMALQAAITTHGLLGA